MKRKLFLAIVANLVLGNLILYTHDIYGGHQTEVSPSLWYLRVVFSLVAIILLFISARILKAKESTRMALLLSLIVSFLIPMLGIFILLKFSFGALFIGSLYLLGGFLYLILPMWILNFFAFRWIQKAHGKQ